MAFDELEISNYGGEPIVLYEFHRSSGGAEFYWRYTTADADVLYGGNTYIATAISDSGVRQTGETASSDLTVTMPVVEDLPGMFRTSGSSPSDTVFLTVRRAHPEISPLWATNTAGSSGNGYTVALASGDSLLPGGLVTFNDYTLIFQMDGNVVLLQGGVTVLWATATDGSGATGLFMQTDGNLVLYAGLTVLWESNTDGNPGAQLLLQGDGNLVIYSAPRSLNGARVVWMGTLAGMTQPDEVKVDITCSTLVASFKRGGLRLSWTRGCPHALYDPQCKVTTEALKTVAAVVSHTGNSIVSGDFAAEVDGWFNGGYVEWSLPSGIVERRGITIHVGDTITVMGNIFGLLDGGEVNAFPGCLRIRSDCNDKFNNLPNYGGFPHIPGKSPFSGDPIF